MKKLFGNIRFWILLTALLTALLIGASYGLFTPFPFYSKLVQTYAFFATGMLYITLLISPITQLFPKIPYKAVIIHARRATGVSTIIFACLHAWFAFFDELGGFRGLLYLDQHYLVAITVGAIVNTILVSMAVTSFDYMVRKMGPWWKRLHRLVYLASFLIIFHALSIGSHFIDLRTPTARVVLILVFALLILEALRMDRVYRPQGTKIGVFTIFTVAVATFSLAAFTASTNTGSLSVHAGHLAATQTVTATPALPQNDPTKRYSVSAVTDPVNPQPGQPTTMTISVFDARTGNHITEFTKLYDQFMHIVIVDTSLQQFAHIHPTTTAEGTLVATYTFPNNGRYHVYFNFVPYQAPEQEIGTTITVGNGQSTQPAISLKTDTVLSRTIGDYTVTMSGTGNLDTADLSVAKQPITFTVYKGNDPASLAPYIGAFGHLTLINTSTYEFIHAHPQSLVVPKPTDRTGPLVSFYPMGLYGPITPGVYRIFAEFAPDGNYILAPFTITIH